MYVLSNLPANTDPAVVQEFRRLQEALAGYVDYIQLRVLNVSPAKPRAGMIIEADGVNFNPGAGAGCYIYRSGAWVKLG